MVFQVRLLPVGFASSTFVGMMSESDVGYKPQQKYRTLVVVGLALSVMIYTIGAIATGIAYRHHSGREHRGGMGALVLLV